MKYDSYISVAQAITCEIPFTCQIVKNFGQIHDNIKQKIKEAVSISDTLPQRFIDTIIKKL
ncbi:hypothetical protein GMMP15_240002 [Candidatus Magnetomoraceae bacterium gMMP-15]